jgi:WD40 repeat protein
LEGHTDVAAYALEWHCDEPIVASGGRDRQILLWNVEHYFNTHGRIPEEEKDLNQAFNSNGKEESPVA